MFKSRRGLFYGIRKMCISLFFCVFLISLLAYTHIMWFFFFLISSALSLFVSPSMSVALMSFYGFWTILDMVHNATWWMFLSVGLYLIARLCHKISPEYWDRLTVVYPQATQLANQVYTLLNAYPSIYQRHCQIDSWLESFLHLVPISAVLLSLQNTIMVFVKSRLMPLLTSQRPTRQMLDQSPEGTRSITNTVETSQPDNKCVAPIIQ